MTELTIDQALQQGIEAHKAGQVQEADRLYTAILKAQPKHPDANHNMGVLAVGVGQVEQALPFFKTAVEANPSISQFWLSLIDALIKLKRLPDAQAVLDQVKSKGAKGDGFDQVAKRLKEALQGFVEVNKIAVEKLPKQPNILDTLKLDQAIKLAQTKAKKGDPAEARHIYQDILTRFPKNTRARDGLKALGGGSVGETSKLQISSQDQLQSVVNLYGQGLLQQALKQAEALVPLLPNAPDLFNLQGAVLKGLGQIDRSIDAYKKAIAIKPDYADAYNNMGIALKELGKLEEAIEAYGKAITFKPNYAEAYNNLGVALKEQNKLEEAIEAYGKAITFKPNYADAYSSIGVARQDQGKIEEAIEAYNKALAIKPDYYKASYGLASAFYKLGDLPSAMMNLERVNSNTSEKNLDHSFSRLPYKILSNFRNVKTTATNNYVLSENLRDQNSFPIIVKRSVESELIKCLYEMSAQNLDDTKDARYGVGRCSPNFNLFASDEPIIRKVSFDLLRLMEDILGVKVLHHESFFNILGSGGGTTPHSHVKLQDRHFDLDKYKYSLVYYLSVGDQKNCTEPGTLKLFEPAVDILPTKGMAVLIPANRAHCAVYNGLEDRIMIGCNFYAV